MSQRRVVALQALQQHLGVVIDEVLLDQALTHRSYAYEHGDLPHNERLEFLGDAVLSIVITDELYRRFPDLPEGQLAKLRAAVVNSRALADVARSLNLGSCLILGRGEQTTGGSNKSSILADALEAIIGAIHISAGLDQASTFIHAHFDPLIEEAAGMGAALDWKTSLQEATAAAGLGVPEYLVTDTGPDHEKEFTARVKVGDGIFGSGHGRSKKVAEQFAAEQAYRELRERGDIVDAGTP
jgi:ribonuclease III